MKKNEILKKGYKNELTVIIVAALLVIAAAILLFAFGGRLRGYTVRIKKYHDAVLEDNGREKSMREDQRLHNDEALTTGGEGYVKIGLDDTKIITLQKKSRLEVSKKGDRFELDLESGSLYFDVNRKLEPGEVMEFNTSTMIVGIRGTEGNIFFKDGYEGVAVNEGTVHVTGFNHTTGETKETDVSAGKKLTVNSTGDTLEFVIVDIPHFDQWTDPVTMGPYYDPAIVFMDEDDGNVESGDGYYPEDENNTGEEYNTGEDIAQQLPNDLLEAEVPDYIDNPDEAGESEYNGGLKEFGRMGEKAEEAIDSATEDVGFGIGAKIKQALYDFLMWITKPLEELTIKFVEYIISLIIL